ncbi:hypothetical protein P8C59_009290 [Phyllachora maydis]|uniref:Uncharacterized protein n=1 Tax=Phyllachora maydis TaxID=1825666 RepID=A0AAD9ICB5_9PEZI|nr:hypothetical protein P8C59_009290 [Phyllachora maydis]
MATHRQLWSTIVRTEYNRARQVVVKTYAQTSADGLHYGDLTATSHAAPASKPYRLRHLSPQTLLPFRPAYIHLFDR